MKRLGITVTIRKVDDAQYTERLRHSDFDMIIDEMPQSLIPSSEQAQFWGSEAADQVGNYNYAGIKSAVIDNVIQQVIDAPNRDQLIVRISGTRSAFTAGYYQIPTYGKGENWFAYWNMYQQPNNKTKVIHGY